MSKRDIIILSIATLVIIGALVLVLGSNSKKKSGTGPQPPKVTKVITTFDNTTVERVRANFPVDLDLNGLGRPDPFAGI
jgi:hypothetical protein